MDLEDTGIGTRYRVTFTDCCVEGGFEAEVVSKNYVPDAPEAEPFLQSVTFANGVTFTEFIAVDAEPVTGG